MVLPKLVPVKYFRLTTGNRILSALNMWMVSVWLTLAPPLRVTARRAVMPSSELVKWTCLWCFLNFRGWPSASSSWNLSTGHWLLHRKGNQPHVM